MSFTRALAAAVLAVAPLSAAELKTLKGEVVKGDIVSVSDKEIVLEADGKKVSTPVDQVLSVSIKEEFEALGPDTKYALVELTDGSQLKCARVTMKGKEAVLTLLQGQEVATPVAKINWVVNEAHVPANLNGFKEKVLGQKWTRDVVVIRSDDDVINPVRGTIGDADAEGKVLKFTQTDGREREIPIGRPVAFFWVRGPDATAKPVVCKLTDTTKNLLWVASVARTPDGFTVVTSSGAEVKYATEKVAKLDYSTAKISYLSQLTPTSVKETSNIGRVEPYRKDENLDGGEIRLGGTGYKFGLSLHATTELEYTLEGEYREFKAVAGFDDDVGGGDGPTVLKIYGDDNELLSQKFERTDKERTRPIAVNIKDVKKLRIVVTTGDLLDLGKHLTLAEARVTK